MSNALYYQLRLACDRGCSRGMEHLGSIGAMIEQMQTLRVRNAELEQVQSNYDRALNSMPAAYRVHFSHVRFGDPCDCVLPPHIIPI